MICKENVSGYTCTMRVDKVDKRGFPDGEIPSGVFLRPDSAGGRLSTRKEERAPGLYFPASFPPLLQKNHPRSNHQAVIGSGSCATLRGAGTPITPQNVPTPHKCLGTLKSPFLCVLAQDPYFASKIPIVFALPSHISAVLQGLRCAVGGNAHAKPDDRPSPVLPIEPDQPQRRGHTECSAPAPVDNAKEKNAQGTGGAESYPGFLGGSQVPHTKEDSCSR